MKKPTFFSKWVPWVIENSKLVYIAAAGLTVLGALALFKMNKDEFPTFEIMEGLVAGVYPGADASEVESQLTCKLEETLLSFKEIRRGNLRSVTREGMCYIYVSLDAPFSKKDQLWSKIKLKLQERKATLPAGVLAVAVLDDFSDVSAYLLALESEDKSYTELQEYADDLCEKLRTIPELASTSVTGRQTEEIAVTVDRTRLAEYAIDPTAIFFNYQTSALPVPAGSFDSGFTSSTMRVKNPVSSEAQTAERIVYSDPSGNVLKLKDVAKVERRIKKPTSYVDFNGHSCLVISVVMKQGNNIVDFGKKVDAVLQEFNSGMPDSVKVTRIFNQPEVVKSSVLGFLRDLMISMIVVILVMLALFPMNSALIAGAGVPICTAISIGVMWICGIDLNTVTLGALIATLGMIVDNSIIMMDGYMGELGKGLSRKDCASKSISTLFAPTLAATLAISAMFFPARRIISGYLGEFIQLFPYIFVIALLVSLLFAITVTPSLETHFITSAHSKRNNILTRAQNTFFNLIEGGYAKAEAFCFRHPAGTLISGLATVGLGVLMFLQVNIQMMPMADRDFFVIEIEVDGGNGLARTKYCSDSLQNILLSDEKVKSVTSFIGTGAPRFAVTYNPVIPGKTIAQLVVNTVSKEATEELLPVCGERFEHIFPDALVRVKQMDYQLVQAPVAVTFKGPDRERYRAQAEELKKFMFTLDDEICWIHSTADDMAPSVDIELNPEEAPRLGVNKTALSLALAGTFNGENIGNVWEGSTAVPVNLYSDYGEDPDYSRIGNTMVTTMIPGVSVPLRQVATVTPKWSAVTLEKQGGEECITVMADMKFEKSQPAAMKKIKRFIKENISVPEDVTIEYGGLTKTNTDVAPEILWSFIAAVSILFLFLFFHFKKLKIAALTLVMSSLCLFGASLGLFVFRLDFGLTAVLGLISLVGIIVRNGIILFEYAEHLHFGKGMSVKEAAIEAGKRRMRPIFLTSCTTALGVLPMVIGKDMLWRPMGVVICFGTLLSIFLIVLIMPVSYWQVFKKYDKE